MRRTEGADMKAEDPILSLSSSRDTPEVYESSAECRQVCVIHHIIEISLDAQMLHGRSFCITEAHI